MNLQIDGHHLQITAAIQERVQTRVEHLNKYFDGLHSVRVILTVEEPRRTTAELVCGVVRGQQLVARAAHEDLYQAIDEAVHKAKDLLIKYKDRLRSKKRVKDVPSAP